MKIIDDALALADEKLERNLRGTVSIETIRLLFNVCLLRAVQQMKKREDHRGDEFFMSRSAGWYFDCELNIDPSDINVHSCIALAERRDYEYSRAVTDDFFNSLLTEEGFVEDRLAFLAMELPDYYMCSGDLPDLHGHKTIVVLLRKAMKDSSRWLYVGKRKVKEIKSFTHNYLRG